MTQSEYAALRAWAERQGLSLGDAARLALLEIVAEDAVSFDEIDPACEPVGTVPARRSLSERHGRAD